MKRQRSRIRHRLVRESPHEPRTRGQRMCLDKRQLSERAARRLARVYQRRVYRCPLCRCWHLTSLD